MRKQTRSLISSWLLMTFKAPRSQIPATRNVNTSSSLPWELAQRLSTLASESSGALVKTSPPTHRTSDSLNQDEAPNFAFLSRFQVMWMLPIRDHALQTFTCRNRASLWSQVNHISYLTSNPSCLLRSLTLAIIVSFLYLRDLMWKKNSSSITS